MNLRLLFLLGLFAFAGLEFAPSLAYSADPLPPFGRVTKDWARTLKLIETFARQPDLISSVAERHQQSLTEIQTLASRYLSDAKERVQSLQRLAKALGPEPTKDAEKEPASLTEKRKKYAEEIAFYQARISETELAVARASEMAAAISLRRRQTLWNELFRQYPMPFLPATIQVAAPELGKKLAAIMRAPFVWWRALTPNRRQDLPFIYFFVITVMAGLIGWIARHYLLRFFGRDHRLQEPSYSRRLAAAIAEGVAGGIIPALILAGILWRVIGSDSQVSGAFADMVVGLCISLILVVLAITLPRTVLVPNFPEWSLAPIGTTQGRAICRRINLLAIFFAIDLFLRIASSSNTSSPEFFSFISLVNSGLEGAVLFLLMKGRLWQSDNKDLEPETEAPIAETQGTRSWLPFWPTLRIMIALSSAAGIIAGIIGYSRLSVFLIENLIISGGIIGAIFLLRGLFREVIGVTARSRWAIEKLRLRHQTRKIIKFWLRAFVEIALFAIAAAAIAPYWGIPFQDLARWLGAFLQGFEIGSVRISILDIAIAIGVFLLGLIVTRMLQRALTERVLPQTQLDAGVRNSLSSGLGYVGLIIAAALAVSLVGFDLSNIALIAGALSVGIGFGLQNIVNNFVSGLILLIERPVKVGDWIVVGNEEGYVQQINVRATELQTFQRASVIIPNADLLSNAVTNWTHKDRHGRIEISIGVAYGSDTSRVREILLACADQNEQILKHPAPFVLFQDFGANSLDFELRCFTNDVVMRMRIASELRFEIDKIFRQEKIEIPFPQRVVHMASDTSTNDP